ncbi:ATP-binding cassette subfamily B protein [Plasticicumulans lactativorans]|uniref:ATP-binding cassette subfamily B protein n=1 Tax=Plasticicumulans lactativorans TaxID=1133106 RepID=A0A4R2LUS9_9GAMM|nr:ABC transporter ATP-binding protein [Plasticicumulans lactativorans]TCO83680.1 ATP-binding cassette subfamily B protein [Plasticicumulans lactativorans]
MHALQRLWHHARAYRRDIRLATLYSALNKLFDILPEVLIGVAVDSVVNRGDALLGRLGLPDVKHQLLLLGALTIAIWVCESLFEYLYSLKWRGLAQALQHDLRLEAYDHVQHLDLGWFEERSTGNLLAILNDDINQLERFLNGGANQIIQVFCSSLLVGLVFFVLTPQIAVLALVPVPFILYGAFFFQRRLAPRYAAVREQAGRVNGRLNNNILGVATIKAFTAEDYELDRIRAESDAYREANHAAIAWSAAITPVIRMAIMAGFVATLVYGGWLTLDGELAVGAYSVLVFLTQRLLWPLTGLAEITDLYQRSMASIDRVLGLLETPVRSAGGRTPLPRAAVRGELEFDDVSFAYGTQPVLEHVTLRIPAGHTVAFVGNTGSGKTTLARLLLRFFEIERGAIRLDGRDIRELDLRDLRHAIGFVSQDSFLTEGTVADNIAYGSFGASRAAIVAAAQAAEAHEFIERLPQGYDTAIGERGQKLSGGQRQRLALARAILKDAPILVLDEATSAVDNETEAAIQHSLEQMVVGRTTLLIAHRLSTVRHADRICVLERGRIVEAGTHEQLLARGGSYAALWRLQTGERGGAPQPA